MPEPSTSLVLFDIDGTLLRNAGSHHREALVAGIRAATGLTTTLDGVDTAGMLDRELIRAMMRASGASENRVRVAMKRVVAECQSCYTNHCAHDLTDRVCCGVPEFMKVLHDRGAVLGLVTGNLSAIGWKKLELAGLRSFFSFGAFAEDGSTRARLAAVAFQRAVRDGLITRTARVSLIGDHANDIVAAKANKFLSVAVATGMMSKDQLQAHAPDILVEDLTALNPTLLL